MSTKEQLREIIRKRIARLTVEERLLRGQAVAERLVATETYRRAQSVFFYYSTPDEVDTRALIASALAEGKKVYLPRIEGEDDMVFVAYDGEPLVPNGWGILEPAGPATTDVPDLVLIPLRGFDRARGRLGRGKGYYDGFLSSYHGAMIALAFSEQELDSVPMDAWDVRLDCVITDKEILL